MWGEIDLELMLMSLADKDDGSLPVDARDDVVGKVKGRMVGWRWGWMV